MNWLGVASIISISMSIGLTLNFTILMLVARHYQWKLTLDFNRYKEGLVELVLIAGVLVSSTAGIFYLATTYHGG